MIPPRFIQGMIIALVTLIADQWSKWLATEHLVGRGINLIPDFFDLILVHNLGAAFSIFTDLPPIWRISLLAGIALIAALLISYWLWHCLLLWPTIGFGLVLGGAVGNLLDRLRLGSVVDFFFVHWHELGWPVFNVADSAITVGIGMLLWDSFRKA